MPDFKNPAHGKTKNSPTSRSVEPAASTTPHGQNKAVEPAASTTPCEQNEAVEPAASTTSHKRNEAVEPTASTIPCGHRIDQNSGHAPKNHGHAPKNHGHVAANEIHRAVKNGHTTTVTPQGIGHATQESGDAASRVFYCFILSSFIFALVVIPTRVIFDEGYRASTEYRLILFQLTAGLVFLRLPRILSRPLGIEIPHGLHIAYMLFLWAAIFLGEFALLYYRVPFWDTVMHFYSGVLLALLGLSLPALITGESISPLLSAILALGFSVLVGVLWEVYEFTFDGILGLNMQKFARMTSDGLSPLVGRAALSDTMTDLIVDLLAALVTCTAACLYVRKNGKLPPSLTVSRSNQTTE